MNVRLSWRLKKRKKIRLFHVLRTPAMKSRITIINWKRSTKEIIIVQKEIREGDIVLRRKIDIKFIYL